MTAPLFLDLEAEVHDLFAAKLKEFAFFCRENWQMTERDIAESVKPIDNPDAYLQGYNAAMTDGLDGALDCWLEEMGYT